MTRYRRRPTEVEAFQLGDDHRALAEFLGDTKWRVIPLAGSIVISAPIGDMIVRPGQWIVRGDAGLYSLDDRAFRHAYEPVKEARDDG